MKKKILSLISVGLSSIVFSMLFCTGLAEAITVSEANAACSALGGSMQYTPSGSKCAVSNLYIAKSSTDSRLKNSCSTLGGKITHDKFLNGYVCSIPKTIIVDSKPSNSSSSSGGSNGKTNSTSKTNATNKKATSGTAESAKNRDLKAQESKSNNIGLNTGKTVADNATKSAKNSSNSGGGSKSPEAEDGEDAKTITVNREPRDTNHCGGVETSFISCDDVAEDGSALFRLLAIVLNVVTYGVGAAAVLGVVITGYQYITARDNNVAQVAKAKNRMLQIVIGLAIWIVFWGVLQFLLPGGLFGNGQ